MTISTARRVSLGMVVVATCALWVATAVVSPPVLVAASCCSECEAKESACYASCSSTTHSTAIDDAIEQCNDRCFDELYTKTYGCFRHCVTCSPGQPNPSKCYTFVLTHEYYCSRELGGTCIEWSLVPNQNHGHVFYAYESSSGYCTS